MSQPSVALATMKQDSVVGASANVSIRGTSHGLEISISGAPSTSFLSTRLTELFAEGPNFFAGNTVRVTFDSTLPSGALACLEEVATRFELRIVEVCKRNTRSDVQSDQHDETSEKHAKESNSVSSVSKNEAEVSRPTAEAQQDLATGAESHEAERAESRLVIGPVRSGVIVEHQGHMIVIGDVNPGAHVRATGSIVILGRLRGVAHAAIGRESGFIIALTLQPQQLRIGRVVARAADSDRPSDGAEIAYLTGNIIMVERYCGRLPSGLAASM